MSTKFQVIWDNGHASGALTETFDAPSAAEAYGNNWLREMISADEDPAAAEEAYTFEVQEIEPEGDDEEEEPFDPIRDGWVGKDGRP